jgi:hypothetical protein
MYVQFWRKKTWRKMIWRKRKKDDENFMFANLCEKTTLYVACNRFFYSNLKNEIE